MTGSTTPCAAELGSQPLPSPTARRLPPITSPSAVAAQRWQAIPRGTYPHIKTEMAKREVPGSALPRSLADRLRALASENKDLAAFLADLASAGNAAKENGLGANDYEAFANGLPLEPNAAAPAPHMQALMHDFRRRQRQASLLVTGCVVASFLLTLAGIAAFVSFAKPASAEAEPTARNSSSIAWKRPQAGAPAQLILASAGVGEPGKSAPSPTQVDATASANTPVAAAGPAEDGSATPKLILLTAGRPLALAPLLSQRQARYVLVRGLPNEATLSAGQRNPSGAWLVKDKDLGQLTLSIGGAASGDYPVEIYALGTGHDAPQGRQRLVFRVAAATEPTAAVNTSASQALMTMALSTAAPGATAPDSSMIMARAMRLLDQGDIASARLLFLHLADQGESEAAYELARTFDAQALAEIGAKGVDADRTRAVSWYERASETGSVKAAERLRTLASLSD
jgi:TPR repeat protein